MGGRAATSLYLRRLLVVLRDEVALLLCAPMAILSITYN